MNVRGTIIALALLVILPASASAQFGPSPEQMQAFMNWRQQNQDLMANQQEMQKYMEQLRGMLGDQMQFNREEMKAHFEKMFANREDMMQGFRDMMQQMKDRMGSGTFTKEQMQEQFRAWREAHPRAN
jgi:hypothetical protein